MKKICMIVPSLSAKGGITAVVSGYRGSKLEEKYDIKYIETYCDGGIVCKLFIVLKAYFSFIYTILFWKPSIIHIHSSFGGSFYRKLPFIVISDFFHKTIINHIHGADFKEFYLSASKRKKDRIKKVYDKCTVIVALSKEWENNLKRIVDEKKIIVIENYGVLNLSAIKERQEKKNTNNILFLGFVCKRKGCYDIPQIVEIVKKDIPDVKFVLAGSGEIKQVKSIVPDTIKENIVFPGWVRDKQKDNLLREADLFFLPSYYEGMPMSILEAMSYGLPIVSTSVGGITKIVHDKENGFVAEPGDIEKLSKSIITLLTDTRLLKEAGNNSVLILKNGYSLDQHINKLISIYGD